MPDIVDEYLAIRPGERLRPHIGRVSGWLQAGVAPDVHHGLPSPWLTFILTLHEPLVLAAHLDPAPDEGHDRDRRPKDGAPAPPTGSYEALIGGLHTTPAVVTHAGWQSGVQVAIHPLAARAVFGVPAGELAGRNEHAADVAGAWVARALDRLRAAEGWPARFAVVGAELTARLDEPMDPAPELRRAWALLCRGDRSVAAVAAEVGWSARRLHARCLAELGLAPQELRRVARFDRARRAVAAGVPMVRVAAGQGYTDQAHLTRDFRRFAGAPPSHWLAAEGRSVQDTVQPRATGSGA